MPSYNSQAQQLILNVLQFSEEEKYLISQAECYLFYEDGNCVWFLK